MRSEAVAPALGTDGGSVRFEVRRWAGLVVAAGLAAATPLVLGAYGLRVGTTIFMYVALAQFWNLVGGYAGLLSLAHPAFFGTGAVVASVLLINGAPLALAVLAAAALSALIALLIGYPTLRLRGHYFVVATLLVAEALRNVALNMDAFGFRGGVAMNIISFVGLSELSARSYNLVFYYALLALAVGAMLIAIPLDGSRWGYAIKAYRDNREAADALGIPSTRLLLVIFMVSAAGTSLVGSAWAAWLGTVEANDAFALQLTFHVIVMVFLGGKGTPWGPTLGVVLILMLEEFVGVEFAELSLGISGLIVVLVVLFLPGGLIRLLTEGPRVLSPRALKANLDMYRVR